MKNAVIAYFEKLEQKAMFLGTDTDRIHTVLKALRKQEPTPVGKCETRDMGVCPNCNKFIRKYEQAHGNNVIPCCKWCGQRLKWEDEWERIRDRER